MRKKDRTLGLTGTNSSGKGAAAEFFIGRGYAYFSLSDVIREELKKKNSDITRDNLIMMGNLLRKNFGADILARRAMENIKGNTIIDSIRNPREVEYLKSRENFILLAVDAPVELRYERAVSRGRDESAQTLEAFIAKEKEEMTDRETGQQLQRCMQMADFLVTNEGSLDELHRKLETFL